jgi:predicted DNA-binding antitoxin AbrB/MazE fold protein
MSASPVIECIYEDGVFKPLKDVNIKEGTKLKIRVEKEDRSEYRGMFGKASEKNFKNLKEMPTFDLCGYKYYLLILSRIVFVSYLRPE